MLMIPVGPFAVVLVVPVGSPGLAALAAVALLCFFLTLLVSPFRSKSRLEAENVALRRQLIILRRKMRGRVHLTNGDRLFLVQLYRWFPSVLNTITIIRPETLVRWHRAGFRRYWRWKSRSPWRPAANRGGPACADSTDERYEGFCKPMRAITTMCERTDRWTRTRPSRARFSGSDASHRMRCSGVFITTIAESSFRYTQQVPMRSKTRATSPKPAGPCPHQARPGHRACGDAPLRRAIQRCGAIITTPILSGLHHRYVRI